MLRITKFMLKSLNSRAFFISFQPVLQSSDQVLTYYSKVFPWFEKGLLEASISSSILYFPFSRQMSLQVLYEHNRTTKYQLFRLLYPFRLFGRQTNINLDIIDFHILSLYNCIFFSLYNCILFVYKCQFYS